MKHRIFVAVGIGEPLQKEIFSWAGQYQKLPVRWLSGKNLHITLVPPWYEEDVEKVKSVLRRVHGTAHFEIVFTRVSFGPDPRRPRLIWAEGEVPPELAELKKNVEIALHIAPEKRPFRLHLTLARFREEDFPRFAVKKLDERVGWRDAVRSFVLMESHLSQAGADYEVLEERFL